MSFRYACDLKVVQMLRKRTLGNSSSSILKQLRETHSNKYLQSAHHYLQSCKTFKAAAKSGLLCQVKFDEFPALQELPRHRWLMKVYQLDVLQRIDYIKASITSTFGNVLKLDSTKKITKKMAGTY